MHSINRSLPSGRLKTTAVGLAAMLVLLSGCAQKPWMDPLPQDQFDAAVKVVDEMREAEALRGNCIDTDVHISFTSAVTDRAVKGYMVLQQPQSLKFVTSNPFGQPLLIVAVHEENVQYVNTLQRSFSEGTPSGFVKALDIPTIALNGEWGSWLTARLPQTATISGIRDDRENRGFWLEFVEGNAEDASYREKVLIEPKQRLVVEREIIQSDGSTVAEIRYGEMIPERSGGKEVQPSLVYIDGLDYGGELTLSFSQLQEMHGCKPSNFRLKPPPGYSYQYLPATR